MDTIRLQNITIEGFRTFTAKTTFEFPEQGLVLVRGINRDTAGPDVDFDNCPAASGIGKTNLLLAISYLFDFCPLSATQLQSWDENVTMKVTGKFTSGDKKVVLFRAAKGSYIEIDGKKHTSADAIKANLQELTGLTPDLRAILTYRQQRERGMFLHATDSEKKKFLTTVLPWLKEWEVAADTAQKKANEIERDVTTKKAVLDAVTADLSFLSEEQPKYEDVSYLQQEKELLDSVAAKNHLTFKTAKANVEAAENELRTGVRLLRADNGALSYAEDMLEKFDSKVSIPPELQRELVEAQKAIGAEHPVDPALVEAETKARDLLRQVRERLSLLKTSEAERKKEHDTKLKEITTRGAELRASEKMVPGLQKIVDDLKEKISIAEQSLCSQCGQQWVKAKDVVDQWKLKLVGCEEALADAKAQAEKLPAIVAEYEAARVFTPNPKIEQFATAESKASASLAQAETSVRAAVRAAEADVSSKLAAVEAKVQAEKKLAESKKREEYVTLKANVDSERAKIEASVSSFNAEKQIGLASLRELVTLAQEAWGKTVEEATKKGFEIEHAKIRNENAQRTYEQSVRARVGKVKQIEQVQNEHAKLVADWSREADFAKLVGREGYLGSIFDEILEEIAAETNTILVALPNVAHVTVEFLTESVTKSGTTSRDIKTMLRVSGIETTAKGGLSGGQQSAVEWAMDLAVGAVIGRRLGVSMAFLMLDETFDGLDGVTKEAALEVLQSYAQDKLVLVVTHANEFREFFTSFLDIEFKEGVSRLVAA